MYLLTHLLSHVLAAVVCGVFSCRISDSLAGLASIKRVDCICVMRSGCAIGCPKCDGSSRGPIPGVGNGSATSPPTGIGRNKVGPNGVVCQPEEATGDKPTMCDPLHRSINTGAECGGPLDWYYFSPWRAPGLAPVNHLGRM